MNNNTSEETLGEKRRHTITITGEVRRMKRHISLKSQRHHVMENIYKITQTLH